MSTLIEKIQLTRLARFYRSMCFPGFEHDARDGIDRGSVHEDERMTRSSRLKERESETVKTESSSHTRALEGKKAEKNVKGDGARWIELNHDKT